MSRNSSISSIILRHSKGKKGCAYRKVKGVCRVGQPYIQDFEGRAAYYKSLQVDLSIAGELAQSHKPVPRESAK
jgi:hypothetical protein